MAKALFPRLGFQGFRIGSWLWVLLQRSQVCLPALLLHGSQWSVTSVPGTHFHLHSHAYSFHTDIHICNNILKITSLPKSHNQDQCLQYVEWPVHISFPIFKVWEIFFLSNPMKFQPFFHVTVMISCHAFLSGYFISFAVNLKVFFKKKPCNCRD